MTKITNQGTDKQYFVRKIKFGLNTLTDLVLTIAC